MSPDTIHPNTLIDKAKSRLDKSSLLESNAEEKLGYFLKGLLCFSKKELYDLLCQYSAVKVNIEIPFTSEVQIVRWAGTKKLTFWTRDDRFLGEEFLKSGEMFDSFANDSRKGRRFVFVEPSSNRVARSVCIQNILQLIKEEYQLLAETEHYLKEYDDKFLSLISETGIHSGITVAHFMHNLKKEKENEITRNH